MLFLEMQTRTREILEDADSSAYQWSAVIVKQYLNDAARDFAMQTHCIKKQSAALTESATAPDNAVYTLPSDFFEIDRVTNGATNLIVPLITAESLGDNWETATGDTPAGAMLGDQIGDELRIYPIPSAALTALKVWYTAVPPAMSADANPPTGIPVPYRQALVYYAVAMCYRRNFEDGDQRKATEFMALYQREVALCQASMARRRSSVGVVVPYRNV